MAAALLMHYCGLSEETAWDYILDLAVDYPAAWIRLAVIEALYQGRYKTVSVSQILAIWQRRNKPLCHFGREFESIITVPLQNLPRTPPQIQFQATADRLPRRTLNSTLKSLWATRLDQPVPSSPVRPFNPISPLNSAPAPIDRLQSAPQPLGFSMANTREGTEAVVAPGGTQDVTSASTLAIGPNPGIEAATEITLEAQPNVEVQPDLNPAIAPDIPPNSLSGITPGTASGTISDIKPATTQENTLETTQTEEISAQKAPDLAHLAPTPEPALVLTLEPSIEATDPGSVALAPPQAKTPALQPATEVDNPDRPLASPAATIAEVPPSGLVGTGLVYPPPARRATTPPLPIHRFSPLQDSTGFAQKLRALASTSY
ncbi:MAG: hypothetical protein VKK80_14540 [Prochlorothrix sp.]|nr:hypothetical protein [Prochlorothrix sp.]